MVAIGAMARIAGSKPLRKARQYRAPHAKLRRADTDASAVADLIDVVGKVQHIEAQFGGGPELLHHRQVDHGVVWQRNAIRRTAHCGRAQATLHKRID